MELTQIAINVMIALTPTLPYLVAGGTEAAKEVGKSVGKAIPGGAKKIWEVLNYEIHLRPPGFQEAIAEVKKAPEDADNLQMLELQVKKVLKEDRELTKKLLDIFQDESLQKTMAGISQTNQTSSGNYSPNVVSQKEVTMTFGKDD